MGVCYNIAVFVSDGTSMSRKKRRNENMIKLEKKHIKIFSVFIAVVFIGSCVAIGVSQMGSTGVASAASSAVGKIDYRQAMAQSP